MKEAELAARRRLGNSEECILVTQGNLATTYHMLGRFEEALQLKREVYSGRLKLSGDEHIETLVAANNYADSLRILKRFEETRTLLRKIVPVARRVLGENHDLSLIHI